MSAIDSAQISATLSNLRATSNNVTRLTADLDSSTIRLNTLIGRVDRGEGTVGKLMTDTLLYRDIRNLVGRTDSLLADFKANPKKYINLRIF